MTKLQKKRVLTLTQEPLNIGLTRVTKRRVWLDTKVTVRYSDGSTDIETFDTVKEADEYAKKILQKYAAGENNVSK